MTIAKNFPKAEKIHPFATYKTINVTIEATIFNQAREIALANNWSMATCTYNLLKLGVKAKLKELR